MTAAVTTAAVTFAAVTLAAATLAAVTLCRDPRCHTDMKRIEIVPRGNLDAVLLTSHLFIIVYLTINRSSHMVYLGENKGKGNTANTKA